ncbi:hypothetical protein D3C85_1491690 [compost metagenome]
MLQRRLGGGQPREEGGLAVQLVRGQQRQALRLAVLQQLQLLLLADGTGIQFQRVKTHDRALLFFQQRQ